MLHGVANVRQPLVPEDAQVRAHGERVSSDRRDADRSFSFGDEDAVAVFVAREEDLGANRLRPERQAAAPRDVGREPAVVVTLDHRNRMSSVSRIASRLGIVETVLPQVG